jgi:hypothetical protein
MFFGIIKKNNDTFTRCILTKRIPTKRILYKTYTHAAYTHKTYTHAAYTVTKRILYRTYTEHILPDFLREYLYTFLYSIRLVCSHCEYTFSVQSL